MYPWVSAIVLAPLFSGAFLVLFFVLWEWKFPIFPLVPRKFLYILLPKPYLNLHSSYL